MVYTLMSTILSFNYHKIASEYICILWFFLYCKNNILSYTSNMTVLITTIISFLIVSLLAYLGLLLFKKIKLLDRPWNDLKNTRKPVPTLQGIFAYIAFWMVFLILFPQHLSSPIFLGLAIGVLPIFLVELLEELGYMGRISIRIHPWARLLVHIFSALLAVYIGWIGVWHEIILGWTVYYIPVRWFMLFFVVWSIFCVNAINWIDGIYGQASGVSGIGFLTIYLLIKFVVMQEYTQFTNLEALLFIQDASLVMGIISLVYTVVEFKPLGLVRDVGIMFFGFALAYLSVLGGAKIGTLVVALSLVIFDAIWVGLYRIFIIKKSPMKGDYTHLHHRLLGLGWNRTEIRVFVWGWSLIMMVLILLQGTNRINKIIIFVMMALIFFGINGYLFLIKKLPYGLNQKK